ncbi:MAG: oligosaccharide flippase family protein [Bacteroidota bacterium]
MGVIQRQSIKYSIVSFVSVFVGAMSVIFIYPNDRATYGLLQYLTDFAKFMMPLLSLGAHALVIRFFPKFKNKTQQHHGFLGILIVLAALGFLVTMFVFSVFESSFYKLLEPLGFQIDLIAPYIRPIFLLAGILLFNRILTSYISVFGRVVVPNIINNFFIKLLLPALILIHLWGWVALETLIYLLLGGYISGVIVLIIYLIQLGEFHVKPNFAFISPQLRREMSAYALYAILVGSAPILAQSIDSLMVTTLVNAESNGDYNIFRFMSNTIDIALFALVAISAPIISTKFEEEDMEGIKRLYQKTSVNGLVVGSLIFIGIYCNLDDLLHLTWKYEVLAPLKAVFVYLGLAKLFDVATSLNSQIIGFSKYFRFNFWVIILFAIINLINNYLFIQYWGFSTVGAAMATCISIFSYNAIRLLFIWWKFKMLPFTKEVGVLIVLALLVGYFGVQLPLHLSPLLNMVIRSLFIVGSYSFLVLYFRISDDVNQLVRKYWEAL